MFLFLLLSGLMKMPLSRDLATATHYHDDGNDTDTIHPISHLDASCEEGLVMRCMPVQ